MAKTGTSPARKGSRKRARAKRRADISLASHIAALARKVKSDERSLTRMRGTAHRHAAEQRDTEGRIRRKAAEAESLRSTLDIVTNQLKVVADERAAGERDLKAAEKEWTAVQNRVRKHSTFNVTKAAVAAVDAEIDRLQKKVSGLERKVGAADARAAAARSALAAVEKERRDAQEALQRLPNEIRAARGQVTRLLGEVAGAAPEDATRIGATQPALRNALDTLRAHLRRSTDEGLARSLVETATVKKAAARYEAELARLVRAKEELAKTQVDLQTRKEQRSNDISTRVKKHAADHA